jgi:hypothetical protein
LRSRSKLGSIRDLLDHLQRIRDPASPKRIPDPVDLVPDLAGDHDPTFSSEEVTAQPNLFLRTKIGVHQHPISRSQGSTFHVTGCRKLQNYNHLKTGLTRAA